MGAEEEDKKEICIQVNMRMINLGETCELR